MYADTIEDEDLSDVVIGPGPYPFHEKLDNGSQVFGSDSNTQSLVFSPWKEGESGASDPNEVMLNADSFRFTTSILR